VIKLDIAEVAERSSIPASTLRFYEEKGLIASTGRRGLRRLFDADVLDRLALIALGGCRSLRRGWSSGRARWALMNQPVH
jgi:DNA-binding transcriptional MerR regulator